MNHYIKGLIVVAAVSLLLWGGWLRYREFLSQGSKPTRSTQILNQMEKDGVPDFALKSVTGTPVSLKAYAGKVIILNFWASWCGPCVEEMPSLYKLADEFNGDLVVLAISGDEDESDLKSFLKALKVDSPHVVVAMDDNRKVANLYGTEVLPESYVVARNGKLVRKVAGSENWYSSGAIEFFKTLVGGH